MVLIFRKNKLVAAISETDGALLPEFNDIRRPIERSPSPIISRVYRFALRLRRAGILKGLSLPGRPPIKKTLRGGRKSYS